MEELNNNLQEKKTVTVKKNWVKPTFTEENANVTENGRIIRPLENVNPPFSSYHS
jgi:hypothetical protein